MSTSEEPDYSEISELCKEILYEDIAPSVINSDMIWKAIDEQRPEGEAGRLARLDGIEIYEVTKLRLEFLNILRIDHMWPLAGLVKLSLSNNMIEKIENLEELANLTELDLSFNEIEVMENLEGLIKLEILTLFSNRIKLIENLRGLKNLHIFSVGDNKIEDKTSIFHLRKLRNLRSVNVAGNPCAAEENFRIFVGTFLPQITYYEYIRISVEERDTGRHIFSQLLKEVTEGEAQELAQEAKEEAERAEAELHAESFIEFLGSRQLFDSMFEKDSDAQIFLTIDEVETFYDEYEVVFLETTQKLFEVGQERYHTRKLEVQQFQKCVESAKEENQTKSQEAMERFLEYKLNTFKEIKEVRNQFLGIDDTFDYIEHAEEMQKYIEKFNDLMLDTWKELMGLEMNLFDQVEELNLTFERALTDLVNSFIEEAQGYFTQLRLLEQNYMEQVFDVVNRLASLPASDTMYYNEDLKILLDDKELLNNAVAASHDVHMQLIDAREDRLMTRAKEWLQSLVNDLQKNEVTRNRGKVLEINHFLDCQRDEIEDFCHNAPGLNPDVSAALA